MARRRRGTARLEFPPERWKSSAWQERVWEDTEELGKPRLVVLNAGRGAGKDIIATRCILRDALKWYERQKGKRDRGELVEELNPLVKIWVVAAQENNLKQAWEDWKGTLRGLARQWGPACGFDENETDWLFREVVRENKIILFGRGEIELEKRVTSTRDALRGPGVDLVHWTEMATETVPGEFERAFVEELPGTITRSGRLGRIYGTTTPKGPVGGWFDTVCGIFGEDVFREVENGARWSSDRLGYYCHAESLSNEFLTPEQVEQIEAEVINGWRYEQERMARVVIGDLGGKKAFDREWVEKCLVGVRLDGSSYRQVSVGVDIARLGNDETCYCAVDDDSGEVLLLEFHVKLTGQRIVEDLVRIQGMFPGCVFYVDSTGHRGYIADFAPASLQFVETQFSRQKEKWVGGLRMLLQMGKLRIPDPDAMPGLSGSMKEALRKLLKQLLMFLEVVKQTGGIEYRHPAGELDDGVDGLLLASMKMAGRLQNTMSSKEARDKVKKLVF
jgi:hypothetical protein